EQGITDIFMIGNSITRNQFEAWRSFMNGTDPRQDEKNHQGGEASKFEIGGLRMRWAWLPTLSDIFSNEQVNQYYGSLEGSGRAAFEKYKERVCGYQLNKTDLVIMNVGIADPSFSSSYFKSLLQLWIRAVSECYTNPRGRIIWRSNTPLHPPRCWN